MMLLVNRRQKEIANFSSETDLRRLKKYKLIAKAMDVTNLIRTKTCVKNTT
jgi:hypothetical protein